MSKTTLWELCLLSIFVQLALSIQTFRFCGHGHSLPQSNHLLLLPAAPNYELCVLAWIIESLVLLDFGETVWSIVASLSQWGSLNSNRFGGVRNERRATRLLKVLGVAALHEFDPFKAREAFLSAKPGSRRDTFDIFFSKLLGPRV